MNPLLAFTVTMLLAAFLAVVMKKAGLAVIAGYLIAGVVVGPLLGLYGEEQYIIDFFSEIAIALVCFQIGFTVKAGFLKKYGAAVSAAVMVETFIISFVTFLIGIPFGIGLPELIVIIIIASNSSSLVAFSLIDKRKAIDGPSKKVFGITVFEDLVQMTGLALLPSLGVFGGLMVEEGFYRMSFVVFVVLIMFVIGVQFVPKVISLVSKGKDHDLATLALIGLAIAFGFMSSYVGASFALGAFIAGLICSTLEIPKAITDRLDSIRGFFTIIFFVSIGTSVPSFSDMHGLILSAVFAVVVVLTKYFAFVSATFVSGVELKEAIRYGFFFMAISEFSLVISREAYRTSLVGETVFTGTVFAVMLSTLLASKLSDSDERAAQAVYRIVPPRIEKVSEELFRLVKLGLLSIIGPSKFRELLSMTLKKIVSLLAIFSLGSLLLQGSLSFPQTPLVVSGELFVLATMGTLSLLVLRSTFREVEGFLRSLKGEANLAKDVGGVIKGALNSFIALFLIVFLVLNASRFVREAFVSYLELIYANISTFAVILAITLLVAFLFYSRIRKLMKSLEEAVDAI